MISELSYQCSLCGGPFYTSEPHHCIGVPKQAPEPKESAKPGCEGCGGAVQRTDTMCDECWGAIEPPDEPVAPEQAQPETSDDPFDLPIGGEDCTADKHVGSCRHAKQAPEPDLEKLPDFPVGQMAVPAQADAKRSAKPDEAAKMREWYGGLGITPEQEAAILDRESAMKCTLLEHYPGCPHDEPVAAPAVERCNATWSWGGRVCRLPAGHEGSHRIPGDSSWDDGNTDCTPHRAQEQEPTAALLRIELEAMRASRDELRAEIEAARQRNHDTAHILNAEVGASGPENLDSVAHRAAVRISDYRNENNQLRADLQEYKTALGQAGDLFVRVVGEPEGGPREQVNFIRLNVRNLRAELAEANKLIQLKADVSDALTDSCNQIETLRADVERITKERDAANARGYEWDAMREDRDLFERRAKEAESALSRWMRSSGEIGEENMRLYQKLAAIRDVLDGKGE